MATGIRIPFIMAMKSKRNIRDTWITLVLKTSKSEIFSELKNIEKT